MSRRRIALIAAAATVILALGLTAFLLHRPMPTRDTGQLALAVQNAGNSSADPHQRISTNPSQEAVVGEAAVDWYDATGTEYQTEIGSPGEISRLFDQHGFTNYREDFGAPLWTVLASVLPTILIVGVVIYLLQMLRGGGLSSMGIGRAKAKLVGEDTGVTFEDVAGADEAVKELEEVVSILKEPKRFAGIGARTPRGVLLVGPPGTGKTLLARAVAGEAGVPFFSASGSEFVEMFVGVGASRVRDLFQQARTAGRAIIFIDEIDAVGRHRGSGMGHSNDEREQTLNQLLVEMDGFDNATPIIVIAATNRPDILDRALLRPGRFDRQVHVEMPDVRGRAAILAVHARNRPLAGDVDIDTLARQTPGFSGADLANLINEASLLAARAGRDVIGMTELEDASLRVLAGPERAHSLLSEKERRLVAYHEMGHALVGHVLEHADPVHKISIVSRGRALGFTMQLPDKDPVLHSRNQLTDRLAGLLGGRMAEELVFGDGEITSGASDDIEKATKIAHNMVTSLGMSSLGLRAFLPGDPGEPRTFSEQMAWHVDAEIDHLLGEAADRARQVLTDRRAVLEALAERLLEVETMSSEDLAAIVDNFPVAAKPAAPSTRPRLRVETGGRERAAGSWALPEPRAPQRPVAASASVPVARRGLWWRRTTAALLRLFAAREAR